MANPDWFWPALKFFLGTVAFSAVFLTVVFRLEKRTVSPYGELESTPSFGDPTGYAARWVADAVQAGFVLLGWARDTGDQPIAAAMPCSFPRTAQLSWLSAWVLS